MKNENQTLQNMNTAANYREQSGSCMESLMTISQVIKYMNIGKTTFYKYDLVSKIPHVYIDDAKSIVRFRREDVEAYLKRN